ncbi:MAG: hypothetical protein AB1486_23130 [Planctomycetota bacterium]
MMLYSVTLTAGNELVRRSHDDIESIDRLVHASGEARLFVDLLMPNACPPADETLLTVFKMMESGPSRVVVTGRILYQLSPSMRQGARLLSAGGSPAALEGDCPLYVLADTPRDDARSILRGTGPGAVLAPDTPAATAGIEPDVVVAKLIEGEEDDLEDPLPARFRNRMNGRPLGGLRDLLSRSELDLLEIRGLGRKSLLLLDAWVRRRTQKLGRELSLSQVQTALVGDSATEVPVRVASNENEIGESIAGLLGRSPPCIQDLDPAVTPGLAVRVRYRLVAKGITRLGQLRGLTDHEMRMSWPNFGKGSLANLRDVIKKLQARFVDLGSDWHESTAAFLRRLVQATPLMRHIDLALERMTPHEKAVMTERVLAANRVTLAKLARSANLTRERMRQVERKALVKTDPNHWLRGTADDKLSTLRARLCSPLALHELVECDPWFEGATTDVIRFGRVLKALGCRHRVVRRGSESAGGAYVTVLEATDMTALSTKFLTSAATLTSEDQIDPAVLKFLRQLGAPELAPVLREALGTALVLAGRVVFRPTMAQRVEAVLQGADRPLHASEIEARLLAAGVPATAKSAERALGKANVISLGPGKYTTLSGFARWDHLAGDVLTEVSALMEMDPSFQWSANEILTALQEGGLEWAVDMPEGALACLLARQPAFTRLGRGLWCLSQSKPAGRRYLVDIAREILLEKGRPLPLKKLRGMLRQQRSFYNLSGIRWPLVRLGSGLIGLGDRDLGLAQDDFERLQHACREKLERQGGRLDGESLGRLLARVCPKAPSIPPEILARILRHPPQILLAKGGGLRLVGGVRQTAKRERRARRSRGSRRETGLRGDVSSDHARARTSADQHPG